MQRFNDGVLETVPGQEVKLNMQQVQHAKQETGRSLYLNEPPLYQLLVSRKKAVIDLREDHLSRCVRSRGRRSEVREG